MTLLTDTASPEEPGAEGCWLEGLPGVPAATTQHRADKQSTCVVNQSRRVTQHFACQGSWRGDKKDSEFYASGAHCHPGEHEAPWQSQLSPSPP